MITILLALILLVLGGTVALSFLAIRRLKTIILAFVSPEAPEKPSPLANSFMLFADMIARSLVAQAKTFLMAEKSADVRQANAEAKAANPFAGMLPRTLTKNPLAMLATQFLMSKLIPGGGLPGVPNQGGDNHQVTPSDAPKFRL